MLANGPSLGSEANQIAAVGEYRIGIGKHQVVPKIAERKLGVVGIGTICGDVLGHDGIADVNEAAATGLGDAAAIEGAVEGNRNVDNRQVAIPFEINAAAVGCRTIVGKCAIGNQ